MSLGVIIQFSSAQHAIDVLKVSSFWPAGELYHPLQPLGAQGASRPPLTPDPAPPSLFHTHPVDRGIHVRIFETATPYFTTHTYTHKKM